MREGCAGEGAGVGSLGSWRRHERNCLPARFSLDRNSSLSEKQNQRVGTTWSAVPLRAANNVMRAEGAGVGSLGNWQRHERKCRPARLSLDQKFFSEREAEPAGGHGQDHQPCVESGQCGGDWLCNGGPRTDRLGTSS